MITKLKLIAILVVFLSFFDSKAQKTVKFNGKPYLIYPQTIDVGYSGMKIQIYSGQFEFSNNNMPPVIGTIEDGEYLMYSTQFELTNKRKFGGYYIYDTNFLVFATITIKNNKKEGIARFYTKYNQVTPYAEIPYQNDMINGSFVFHQLVNNYSSFNRHYYYRESESPYIDDYNEDEVYTYYRRNRGVMYSPNFKTISRIYKLNYKDGVPDGKQFLYLVSKNKKDTVLGNTGEFTKGAKNGTFQEFTYFYSKKKSKDLRVYKKSIYTFVNSKKEGIWIDTFFNGYKEYNYYLNDLLIAEKDFLKNGDWIKYKVYSKDSVMKYIGSLDKEKTYPKAKSNYYYYEDNEESSKSSYKNYYYIKYGPGYYKKDFDYTFVLKDIVRSNYYRAESFSKDTIIQGKLVLLDEYTYKNNFSQTAYLVDSCNKITTNENYDYSSNRNQNAICKKEIWSKNISKNNETKINYSELYYRVFNADSLTPKFKKAYKEKHSVEEKYYQAALDYTFYNKSFTKGKYKGYKEYYVVSGGFHDGRILKVLKIPTHYDTLTLTDTIMLKGKFLYTYNEEFYNAFGEYDCFDFSSNRKLGDRSYFNDEVFDFFKPHAINHTSIYLGNKPFTGDLNVKFKYTKNANRIKATVYDITYFFEFLIKRKVIDLTIELDKERLKTGSDRFMLPLNDINCHVEESVFNGEMSASDIFYGSAFNFYYYNNKINSELNYKLFTTVNNQKRRYSSYYHYDFFVDDVISRRRYKYYNQRKIKIGNVSEVPTSSINFDEGKKTGQWQIVNNSQIISQLTYKKDQKHGMQYVFSRYGYGHLKYTYNALKDTVEGKIWGLYESGIPQYSGYFNRGIPHGDFINYFNMDTTSTLREKFQFERGFLVGQYQYYRDSGELKYTIDLKKEDSMQYSIFKRVPRYEFRYENGQKIYKPHYNNDQPLEEVDLSGSDFVTSLFSSTFIKNGYYKYYYKSGTVFSKGSKRYNTPYGMWEFYREGKDRIYKKINFHDSILRIDGTDTIMSFGTVTAFYDDGRIMFKGLALDKETKYSCESESDIPTEEDHYLEFYDSLGNNILKDGSGFIEELQANGYKLKEGQIKDGKKEGIWIYYSKFGLPNAIGSYVNGKKEGRWLVGDLGGLNLTDKICFMSNEEFIAYINTYGGNLNLTEEFYTNGIKVSKNSVETIKR